MNEIQTILDNTFPFVSKLLEEYGEFYPLASAINVDFQIEQIILEEDKEYDFPFSTTVIAELKKQINWNKDKFVAFAIFYDVKLHDENTDAIAILVEHKLENLSCIFYFPYKLVDDKLTFSESWKTSKEMEIFVP
jgi:hypothetical protein